MTGIVPGPGLNPAPRALAYLSDEDAAPWLLDALGDAHGRVRMNALHALGRLGTEGFEELLAERLREDHPRARRAALALGRTGNEFALGPLQETLEDDSKTVRRQADWALAKVDKRLKNAHQTHPEQLANLSTSPVLE